MNGTSKLIAHSQEISNARILTLIKIWHPRCNVRKGFVWAFHLMRPTGISTATKNALAIVAIRLVANHGMVMAAEYATVKSSHSRVRISGFLMNMTVKKSNSHYLKKLILSLPLDQWANFRLMHNRSGRETFLHFHVGDRPPAHLIRLTSQPSVNTRNPSHFFCGERR